MSRASRMSDLPSLSFCKFGFAWVNTFKVFINWAGLFLGLAIKQTSPRGVRSLQSRVPGQSMDAPWSRRSFTAEKSRRLAATCRDSSLAFAAYSRRCPMLFRSPICEAYCNGVPQNSSSVSGWAPASRSCKTICGCNEEAAMTKGLLPEIAVRKSTLAVREI